MNRARRSLPVGSNWGRWTVIGELVLRKQGSRPHPTSYQLCRCECGTEREVQVSQIRVGHTRSCGCLRGAPVEHGECRGGKQSRLHRIWASMKNRCANPRNRGYSRYGGRGITVCPEWSDYLTFREWAASNGYHETLEIDRYPDRNGPYSPGNCRWATEEQQATNRDASRRIEAFGETKTLAAWVRDPRCTVKTNGLWRRLQRGWSPDDAITTPARAKPSGIANG